MTTRESAHALLDALPESALDDALDLLRAMAGVPDAGRDPLDEAPVVDEQLSTLDVDAIEAGWADVRAGRRRSSAEVNAMLAALAGSRD
ncbi:MAG: hypothetical protein ACKVVT_02865 [Dehalococcoidia bacterium]